MLKRIGTFLHSVSNESKTLNFPNLLFHFLFEKKANPLYISTYEALTKQTAVYIHLSSKSEKKYDFALIPYRHLGIDTR